MTHNNLLMHNVAVDMGKLVADAHVPRNPSAHARALTHVAVGIVLNAQGQFLLCSRPQGKVYAGYWEFPGGKVEANETVAQALARELHEELGIAVHAVQAWRTQQVDYPHAWVQLHFCKVPAWTGTPQGREGQQLAWQQFPVTVDPILPGTLPVLQWLQETDHASASVNAKNTAAM